MNIVRFITGKTLFLQVKKIVCLCLVVGLLSQGAIVYAADPVVTMPNAESSLNDQRVQAATPETTSHGISFDGSATQQSDSDFGSKIIVRAYKLTGQDIVPEDEWATLLADDINQELSKPLVEKVKAKIVNYLKAKGYVTASSFLPEQDMSKGIVEITVMPGRFGQIILKNSSGIADEVIWNQLASIKPGDYIIKRNVERALLLVSDLSGAKMKYAQAPGKAA